MNEIIFNVDGKIYKLTNINNSGKFDRAVIGIFTPLTVAYLIYKFGWNR